MTEIELRAIMAAAKDIVETSKDKAEILARFEKFIAETTKKDSGKAS
jgi:hypothetical protein